MSRTDAHTPWWVTAPWYEPHHGLWCNRRYVCNLPERPVRHAGRRPNRVTHSCTWEPVWPLYRCTERLFGKYMPRRYVMHTRFEPERVRQRDTLGEMVKEYNANGELEDADFANYHHRHYSPWWWD